MDIDQSKLSIKETVSYTWRIDNFSALAKCITSPTFYPPSDSNLPIFIGFYSKSLMERWGKYSSVCLFCHGDLICNYQISFITFDGLKVLTKEGNAKFDKKWTIHSWHYFIKRTFLKQLLTNDRLTIFCEVSVLETTDQQDNLNRSGKFSSKSFAQLSQDLKSLLENEKFSDLNLSVGGKEFRVHKAILSARSPVFCAMLENEFKESQQNRIEITDMDVQVCEQLLRYIYTGKVPSMEQFALELFIVADKYQLDSLKRICGKSLSSTMSIETVSNILAYADMHNQAQLKLKCIEFITENCTEVMETHSWKKLGKTRPELLMELYQDMATKYKK